MENAIVFFIEHYLVAWIFVPLVLIYKTWLFVQINGEPQVQPENFIYFSHPNVATTHNADLQQKKKFQNLLTFVLLGLIGLQLVLALPLLMRP